MRIGLLIAVWTLALIGPAGAQQTRAVSGQAGILGEWDLTATLTPLPDSGGRRWSGTLNMKHIGICSVDGPEEKTGELHIRMSALTGAATATLLIDGTECAFKGNLTDGSDGVMACPDRPDVPMMLRFQ